MLAFTSETLKPNCGLFEWCCNVCKYYFMPLVFCRWSFT